MNRYLEPLDVGLGSLTHHLATQKASNANRNVRLKTQFDERSRCKFVDRTSGTSNRFVETVTRAVNLYQEHQHSVGNAAASLRRDVRWVWKRLLRNLEHAYAPHRIGDLWLTAIKDVVFGHSMEEREQLAIDYRSHGSAHEQDILCFIFRHDGKLPDATEINTNVDVCKFLYKG